MLNLKKISSLLQYTYLLFRISINWDIAHLKKKILQFLIILIIHSITVTIVVVVVVLAVVTDINQLRFPQYINFFYFLLYFSFTKKSILRRDQ